MLSGGSLPARPRKPADQRVNSCWKRSRPSRSRRPRADGEPGTKVTVDDLLTAARAIDGATVRHSGG